VATTDSIDFTGQYTDRESDISSIKLVAPYLPLSLS